MAQIKNGYAAKIAGEPVINVTARASVRERTIWGEYAKAEGVSLGEFMRRSIEFAIAHRELPQK